MPQVVFQRALLDGDLRRRVQVLHLATAAGAGMQAEMRAGGAHSLRTLAAQRGQCGLLPIVLAPADLDLHLFAGQRPFDEHHLAGFVVGHALGLDVERLDAKPLAATAD